MVTSERFIEAWAEAFKNGHNTAWLARKLKMEPSAVRNRAKLMRNRGIKLPELPKYKSGESEKLNSLFKQSLES